MISHDKGEILCIGVTYVIAIILFGITVAQIGERDRIEGLPLAIVRNLGDPNLTVVKTHRNSVEFYANAFMIPDDEEDDDPFSDDDGEEVSVRVIYPPSYQSLNKKTPNEIKHFIASFTLHHHAVIWVDKIGDMPYTAYAQNSPIGWWLFGFLISVGTLMLITISAVIIVWRMYRNKKRSTVRSFQIHNEKCGSVELDPLPDLDSLPNEETQT